MLKLELQDEENANMNNWSVGMRDKNNGEQKIEFIFIFK